MAIPSTASDWRTRAAELRPVDGVIPVVLLGRAAAAAAGIDLPVDLDAIATWSGLAALWLLCVAVPAAWQGTASRRAEHALLASVAAVLWLSRLPLGGWLDAPAIGVIAVMLFLVHGVGRGEGRFRPSEFLHRWSPVLLTAFVYEGLSSVLPPGPVHAADAQLLRLDGWLTTEPLTHVFARWETPLLTEWFSLHYASYLSYPVIVAALLDVRGHAETFRRHVAAFTLAMFIGFAGYVLVPARGPWIGDGASFATAFPRGIVIGPLVEEMVRRYSYGFDTFPSLHTANSLLAVYYVRAVSRRAFAITLFCQVNLLLATIYLRMHYTVDLLAGAALAVLVATFVGAVSGGRSASDDGERAPRARALRGRPQYASTRSRAPAAPPARAR